MRISFLGNHEPSFSTESDWAWTYERLGHEVLRFQETGANPSTTDEIWEQSQNADLFHYVHTHSAVTPGSFDVLELLKRFKEKSIPTIGVHLDYWRGLEREKDVGTHPWWHTDYTFTADGGSNNWYREQGINHYYLKAGVVERDCYLGEYREEYACDVAFVGSYHYHPEHWYRPFLIDWAKSAYKDNFRRFAGDVPPHNTIRGNDLNDLYASVKINIGDSLNIGFKHPDYFSDRVFETTGRGGFLIHPYVKGIEDCFEIGKELVVYEYENFAELRRLIDYYLEHDDERNEIRLAGQQRTLKNHTYTNRVKEMFEILKQESAL